MQTVTQWFESGELPVHVGVYETLDDDGEQWFNYFDGKRFHWGFRGPDKHVRALGRIERPAPMPKYIKKRWRGLAEKPKTA